MLYNHNLRQRPLENIPAIFAGATEAWSMSESTGKIYRGVLNTGSDFMGNNVTTDTGRIRFTGLADSYATAQADAITLGVDTSYTCYFEINTYSLPAGTFDVMVKGNTVFSTGAEYRLYLSGNTLTFRQYYTTGQITLTATLNIGLNTVIFGHDATGNVVSLKVNAGALVTSAHSLGTRSEPNAPFVIGNTIGGVNLPTIPLKTTVSINSAIANIVFFKGRYLSSSEQADLRTEILTNGLPWSNLPEIADTLDPNTLDSSEKLRYYNAMNWSKQYQDFAKLTPVTANNQPVAVIECEWSNNDSVASSLPVAPLTKDATLNALPTLYGNGIDTKMDFATFQSALEDMVIFIVGKNDRNSSGAGSHYISNQTSNSYLTHTGSDYGNGYTAGHKSLSGLGGSPNSGQIAYPTSFNIMEWWSVGTEFSTIANGCQPNLAAYKVTNLNPADYNCMFKDTKLGLWWMLGNIAKIFYIKKTVSIMDRARIRKWISQQTGVPTVFSGY